MAKLYILIHKIILFLTPPAGWRIKVAVALGAFTGLAAYGFYIANATSYLSDEPEACINCHVMYPQYTTWRNSSHANVAVCNDCHVPHDFIVRKYYFKAADGMRHSSEFTFRNEPQAIRIEEAGINVVQQNCIRCHYELVNMIELVEVTGDNSTEGRGHLCWDCHAETPHGKLSSLSSAPGSIIPDDSPNVPEWLMNELNKTDKNSNK